MLVASKRVYIHTRKPFTLVSRTIHDRLSDAPSHLLVVVICRGVGYGSRHLLVSLCVDEPAAGGLSFTTITLADLLTSALFVQDVCHLNLFLARFSGFTLVLRS